MDILSFIVGLVGEVAWPLTSIVALLLLRRPVTQVLQAITKLKYKDLELDFGRELKAIEIEAKTIEVLPVPPPKKIQAGGPKRPEELLEEAERLAGDFPEPAVAVAWSAVEDYLATAAERVSGKGQFHGKPHVRAIATLEGRGMIDGQTVSILKRMSNLRNMALHERWNAFGGVSSDEAREFVALARGVGEKLSAITAGGT